ncbi:hypothetical protein Agabi119p4_6436 [Agaricus bisporus var. burnettii]|uniref:Uncharacterized protein n=1 Tax=Agaricus bisporus var. burnettii TaxID=192524 RepID=A0A8H7CCK2_AGABI|nr:hypothetical protein Agabi119p4_6436 [Agaricus bisporus var. burnettii]
MIFRTCGPTGQGSVKNRWGLSQRGPKPRGIPRVPSQLQVHISYFQDPRTGDPVSAGNIKVLDRPGGTSGPHTPARSSAFFASEKLSTVRSPKRRPPAKAEELTGSANAHSYRITMSIRFETITSYKLGA